MDDIWISSKKQEGYFKILFNLLASKHRGHWPDLWQSWSHLCIPHLRIRLQIKTHKWSLSLQQSSLHWCLQHDFFLEHRLLQNLTYSRSWHSIDSDSFPHRHLIFIFFSHLGHSFEWHLTSQVWTISSWVCKTFSHVGMGSRQLVLMNLFLRRSSFICDRITFQQNAEAFSMFSIY